MTIYVFVDFDSQTVTIHTSLEEAKGQALASWKEVPSENAWVADGGTHWRGLLVKRFHVTKGEVQS